MWIFTNNKGEVCRIDNLPYYTITSKLTEGALEKELVAVLKKVLHLLSRLNTGMEGLMAMMSRWLVLLRSKLFFLQF